MAYEYDSRRDIGGGVKGNNTTSLAPAPSVFQPPLPPMRHGNHNQHDTSPPSHYKNPAMRGEGHFKTPPMLYHQSRPEVSEGENRSQDGRYMQAHSTRHMHALPSDKQMFHKKSPFLTSGKGGSFDPYQRQDDTRHPAEASRVADRGGDTSGSRSDNHAADEGHYPFSRDGPSPGRGFARSEDLQQQSRTQQSFPPVQHPGGNMFQNSHLKKRKGHDPPVIDGPRLISHQSSDDSINGLVQKRPRNGNAMPAEPGSLMKSFTPLSPMHSRSFSRDEGDITRFAPRTRSNDNYRIFQSWSSGNSNSGSHSPSDVRLCYDDWQAPDPNARPPPARNGSWEENPMTNREDISNKERTNRSGPHFNGPNKHPPSFHPKISRNGSGHQQGWPSPPSHERHSNQRPAGFENQGPEKNMLPPTNSRNHCQVLHPEDRCGPYQNQLSHHVNPAAQYGRVMDVNRPFWRGQPVPHNMQYGSQRRDDIEDRSKMPPVRGRPASPTTRLSAPTPPVTNGYGRFGNEFHHPSMYDMPMQRGARPPYEPWGNRGRPFGAAVYNHGSGQSNENRESADGYNRPYSARCSHLQSVKIESGPNGSSGMRTADGILLLSLPEDRISLSETLCIVRENVEVFVATEADVKAPAPGRKRPVVEGQVGLRCIHCRSALHQSDKVKRAVCFPSSIKRIYRTVIDMKLDHFKACRFVPIELKMKLEELKATNARSTGTTMQYFVQAAKRMGMYDGTHGIRFGEKDEDGNIIAVKKEEESTTSASIEASGDSSTGKTRPSDSAQSLTKGSIKSDGSQPAVQGGVSFTLSLDLSTSGDSSGSTRKSSEGDNVKKDVQYHTGKANLSLPEDKTALSPLRCFLRENVYAFSATAEDIAVRTPTTFSVVLGQVGIGCIHCHSMRAKERSNRAVCFPFSIGRIYQSVADIQRFHLGECKMVPEPVRGKFLELQSASSKGSKGLATRQYWVTSAKKLGLVDSDSGIRFSRDPSIPLEKAFSLDILAQVASDVTTAAKPLVLPEDKPHIAGFLYVVMKQLQPCRFTEADRNKRRLKDVGCIGVECKHCAGQVDGRKFFWSSVSAVESNFVSVHTHMMECKMIEGEMKTKLAHLKTLRKEQTARLKSGSQKAFFSRVWKRLHAEGDKVPSVNGQPTLCQPVASEPDKAKQTLSTTNSVPLTPSTVLREKGASIVTPNDNNSIEMMDDKPSTTDMPPLATYSSSDVSSPNSSLSSSPHTFPYNAIKIESSPEYSDTKIMHIPKSEILTHVNVMETMDSRPFLPPSSIESPTPSTTDDMMMGGSPFSSPSSIASSPSPIIKDVTLDPSIFSSSASIESPTPASTIDINMENEVSALHAIIKEGHV